MKLTLEVPIEIIVARSVSTGEGTIVDVNDSQLDCAIEFLKCLQSLRKKVNEDGS